MHQAIVFEQIIVRLFVLQVHSAFKAHHTSPHLVYRNAAILSRDLAAVQRVFLKDKKKILQFLK